MKRLVALFVFVCGLLTMPAVAQPVDTAPPAATTPAADPTAALHDELRAVKKRLVDAVNNKDENALIAELDPNISFTAMNNETFQGIDGARKYYQTMMVGASRIVEDMSLTATPDKLSVLYADNRTAVSTGVANAHFKVKGRGEFDVPLRWTATLVNEGRGWKVASAHFSANMFDNPILGGVERLGIWFAAGAGLIGLAIGWFAGKSRARKA